MASAGNKPTSYDSELTGVSLELYNHLLDTGALQSEAQQSETIDNVEYKEKESDWHKRVLYGKSLSWSIAKTHVDNDEGGSGAAVIDDENISNEKVWSSYKTYNEIKEVKDALDSEELARENADTAIQNSVNSEATTRLSADTTLQNNIDSVASDLADEITARGNADTTLQNNISSVASDLADEVTTRENADTTLQNNIDSVASDLADETTARENADTTLQNNIASEIRNRKVATLSAVASISSGSNEITVSMDDFTASDLTAGLSLKLLVTSALTVSSPTININSTGAKTIKAVRNGSLVNLTAHTGYWGGASSTSSRVWDANTTLELIFNGSAWIIQGNPVFCSYFSSDKSYSVYANGLIEQWGVTSIDDAQEYTEPLLVHYTTVAFTSGAYAARQTWYCNPSNLTSLVMRSSDTVSRNLRWRVIGY